MRSRFVVLVVLSACATASPAPTNGSTTDVPELRLPADVHPTRGSIALQLDPAKPKFSGTVEYALEITSPTSTIWLNATELEIQSATVAASPRPLPPRSRATSRFGSRTRSRPAPRR